MSTSKGRALPKETWEAAAKNIEAVTPLIEGILRKINKDGIGERDAQEFSADMMLAYIALKYVAEFASDKCLLVPVGMTGESEKEYREKLARHGIFYN